MGVENVHMVIASMCMTDVETFRPNIEEVAKAHCMERNLTFGPTDV